MKETNVAKVKEKVVELSRIFPMKIVDFGFILHPLISNDYTMINNKLVRITKENWKEMLERAINEYMQRCNTIEAAVFNIRKADRLTLFPFFCEYLNEKDYAELLREIWVLTEFPDTKELTTHIKLFKKAKKEYLMDENELKSYNELPDEFTVYRGLQNENRHKRAMSWTIDMKVAEWFAKRFGFKGEVWSNTVKKENVLAVFLSRNEKEILLNPFTLKKSKLVISWRNENEKCISGT